MPRIPSKPIIVLGTGAKVGALDVSMQRDGSYLILGVASIVSFENGELRVRVEEG